MDERHKGYMTALEIAHYVYGGATCLMGLIPLAYGVFFGIFMGAMMEAQPEGANEMPEEILVIFPLIFGAVFVFVEIMGALVILSGRFLKARRRMLFTQIVAGIMCISVPYGTAIGICTFLVLANDGVKDDYERTA